MRFPKALSLLLLVSLAILVEDAEAGWKFWKKDDKTTTTTTTTTPLPAVSSPGKRPSVGTAIAGAGNPGLAVGVGNSGSNIANNAGNTGNVANNNRNNLPQRPNPGTEVGQQFPSARPGNPAIGGGTGKDYRDWALDLTGAGEPGRPAPKLPSQGPAIAQPNQPNVRPGSPQPIPNQPAPGSRPGSPQPIPNQPSPGARPGSPQPIPNQPSPGTRPGSPQPIPNQPSPGARPGSPQPIPNQPSPGARPGSPQPIPNQPSPGARPGSPQPIPNQPSPGARPGSPQPVPGPRPGLPSQPQTSTLHVGPITPAPPGSTPKSYAQAASGGSFPSPTPPSRMSPGAAVGAIAAGTAIGTAGKVYSSNPTYSKGKTVTNEDLEKLSEALWIKDTNNAWRHIRLNLQKQTSSNSAKDEAPEPLLTVNPAALQINTIDKVLKIYDNYQLDTRTNEYISPAQRNEESLLVDTFLSTNVLSAAMRFLADKGFVAKDYYAYKDTLRRMWFNLYSRGDGKIGSSGFEHVFLTELKLGTEVSGLHNWIYFNAEEVKRRADYLGYIKKVDLGDKAAILKFHAKFSNIDKPVTSMFIGTSPELEMALYTVCFFARPDQTCPVSLGGTKFNIVTHKFRYRGHDLIGSAYPEI